MKNLILFNFLILAVLFSSCEEEEIVNQSTVNARVQIIHNSADMAAQSVDVYLNNELLLDNFSFRTSTPFIAVSYTHLTLPTIE